ncbi:hypothetical protein [Actinophytocola sp.]|uniref:hypothetical protein n=1 Tax=Actinophytocola sp. TaxID=1872138 RepID=UPI00389AB0B5
MTKPGNSDPEEPTADEAPQPADGIEPTAEPSRADSGTEPADKAAAAVEATRAGGPEAEVADPAQAEDAEAGGGRAKARSVEAEEAEPLMAELEKAPPPPREQALRTQAKRRFEEPAPRMLRFSFYFFTAAGLVWLFSMVLSLVYKQQIIDDQIKSNKDPKITPDQISSAVNQILWIVTIAALAFTIFLALFGYKATEGTRRGRALVTIFAVILVIFHLFLNGTQLGILSAMFALVGLALLWAPSSRKYFPPRQVP